MHASPVFALYLPLLSLALEARLASTATSPRQTRLVAAAGVQGAAERQSSNTSAMGNPAAPSGPNSPRAPRRRPPAAPLLLLVPLVLLALAATKRLAPESLCQPLAVQQLLQAANCINGTLADAAAGVLVPAAGGAAPTGSTQRRLRILMLSHDLTLTGAPQVLYEAALRLQAQGHSIR